MKRNKILFYVFTGLLTLFVGSGAVRYYVDNEWAVEQFLKLGFPDWLPYALGAAKFAGLAAIWFVKSDTIKQWAYAGFTFNFLLAIGAHLGVGDGEAIGGVIALVIATGSYFFYQKTLKTA